MCHPSLNYPLPCPSNPSPKASHLWWGSCSSFLFTAQALVIPAADPGQVGKGHHCSSPLVSQREKKVVAPALDLGQADGGHCFPILQQAKEGRKWQCPPWNLGFITSFLPVAKPKSQGRRVEVGLCDVTVMSLTLCPLAQKFLATGMPGTFSVPSKWLCH